MVSTILYRREQEVHLPRWRNGSVIVLHAIGSGSIPLRGTKGDDRQGAEQLCKSSLGRFDSYRPHNWTFGIAGAYASLKN